MPMGMRGNLGMGGAPQMQTRLPPSLQAKMDKVGEHLGLGFRPELSRSTSRSGQISSRLG